MIKLDDDHHVTETRAMRYRVFGRHFPYSMLAGYRQRLAGGKFDRLDRAAAPVA